MDKKLISNTDKSKNNPKNKKNRGQLKADFVWCYIAKQEKDWK